MPNDTTATATALALIIGKLDEANTKISTLEDQMTRLARNGKRTEKQLGKMVELYERERERCDELETTNRENTEKITRIRARLVHSWDRVDTLLWLQKNGIAGSGDVKVVKVEEGEVVLLPRDVDMEDGSGEESNAGDASYEDDHQESGAGEEDADD